MSVGYVHYTMIELGNERIAIGRVGQVLVCAPMRNPTT
jgi:hypothetical protein